jgi:hypothetical protein
MTSNNKIGERKKKSSEWVKYISMTNVGMERKHTTKMTKI